jgi:hypothetical protein
MTLEVIKITNWINGTDYETKSNLNSSKSSLENYIPFDMKNQKKSEG